MVHDIDLLFSRKTLQNPSKFFCSKKSRTKFGKSETPVGIIYMATWFFYNIRQKQFHFKSISYLIRRVQLLEMFGGILRLLSKSLVT